MGRHLNRQDSDIFFQRQAPSCMWSMFNILDYHYWNNFKKVSARRRHRRGNKHTMCWSNPKTISFQNYADEANDYLEADSVSLLEQETFEATPSKQISGKDRIKAMIAKENSARSQLQRAISINQLGQSGELDRMSTDWPNPIIILDRNADSAASRLQVPSLSAGSQEFSSRIGHTELSKSVDHNFSDGKQFSREISHRQFMECVDVLEVFKINKKVFVEIVNDPDVQTAKKLKKSGSFPLAVLPHTRLKPVTLEHKWNETWSFPKTEKYATGIQEQTVVAPKFNQLTSLKSEDNSRLAFDDHESDFSSSAVLRGSNKHGWHQSFMRHLKDTVKKIKHTHKGGKKKKNHASINALLQRVPSMSNDEKMTTERFDEVTIHRDDYNEATSSGNDFTKGQFTHMRRVSSLNESMDKYAQLFENSSVTDIKRHKYQSRSLKLTNEDKSLASGSNMKSFRRRLSLPDLDSFCPLPNEISYDTLQLETPIKIMKDYHRKSIRIQQLDIVEETELLEHEIEGCDSWDNDEHSGNLKDIAKTKEVQQDRVEQETQVDHSFQDQETSSVIISSIEHENESPVSVLETHFQHGVTDQTESSVSKDSTQESRGICIDESDSSVNQQDLSERNSSAEADIDNATTVQKHFSLNKQEDADFNYVRDVLELSGFIEQGHLGTWHSLDQPISPTLFKEFEAYLHQELDHSSLCECDHQLLFDMINKVLLQIYETSLAYFPKPYSFTQRIRPLPKGNQIVDEVWKRISSYQNPRLKNEQSLDDIIARDIAKDDGWMNIQLDVEDIALDLEEMIFDELLDEIMCS